MPTATPPQTTTPLRNANPTAELPFRGSTSCFLRVKPGVVLKYPAEVWRESSAYQRLTDKIAHSFAVERKIFEVLGEHPRIVRYVGWHEERRGLLLAGWHEERRGLLLAEASGGSLQRYLDTSNNNNDQIPAAVRRKWCRQVVEAIEYIHSRGVLHSDLRPDNFLVHASAPDTLDLWLCDFGGSVCEARGLDGGHLPDPGFFDPNAPWESTPATDIFSVGSILYSILTGHWPHRGPGPFETAAESHAYDQHVEELFRQGQFPDVEDLDGGPVIRGCWTAKYDSASSVLRDWDLHMRL